ncbi:MAG: hypothetical protein H6738_16605 [Alphaproteobacteria bacterium]|nr:hypothetical protein [Alphaproteobacteria bacterium]MCB9698403.1 hypothetical protein [Alphaproteobacteria bacterium]
MAPAGLIVLIACETRREPELLLDGPSEVRVDHLGPVVPAPRVVLGDGEVPEGLIWSFSRPGVASIQHGTLLAEGPGEVEVVAEWEGERVAWDLVVELRTELSFVEAPATVAVGDAVDLHLAATEGGVPVDTTAADWTTSDEAVLLVEGGHLHAIAPGTAYVTASARGASAMIEVTVHP